MPSRTSHVQYVTPVVVCARNINLTILYEISYNIEMTIKTSQMIRSITSVFRCRRCIDLTILHEILYNTQLTI